MNSPNFSLGFVVVAATLLLSCTPANADDLGRVTQSRYLRYQFCMERTFGQGWMEHHRIASVLNPWASRNPPKKPLRIQHLPFATVMHAVERRATCPTSLGPLRWIDCRLLFVESARHDKSERFD